MGEVRNHLVHQGSMERVSQIISSISEATASKNTTQVLNTAAIQLKNTSSWALTSLVDLCRAGLLPGFVSGEEQAQHIRENGYLLNWELNRGSSELGHTFKNVQGDSRSAHLARYALDYIRKERKGQPFISINEPFDPNHINEDAKGLKDFIAYLVDWKDYYADLFRNPVNVNDVEAIHILMFDTDFGLPWERGELKTHPHIKLTSAEPFDLPLGSFPFHNIGYSAKQDGYDFSVCTALCLIEVLTDNFKRLTDDICVRSIQETLEKEVSTLFNALGTYYIQSANLIVYREPNQTREERISHETVNAELQSLLKPSQNGSGHQNQSRIEEDDDKVWLSPEDFDEQQLARFFREGILYTHAGANLKAVLFSNTAQAFSGNYFQKDEESFLTLYVYSADTFHHLRNQVDHDTQRALQRFEHIKVDGDVAKGRIARRWQWLSWIYVSAVVILAILAIALNWRNADSIWERLFAGIEFLTFALVGVFGLVKLVGEDPNAIRNTFLGYVRLRTEDDVCRYTGTQNLPLALALYDKTALWANGNYTCYALNPTYGGISVVSGLDMKSAHMAGIYPISESVAIDLRIGKLRNIVREEGPESNVFRLGKPVSHGTEINPTSRLTEGIFRGPS